ncbi:MAG: alpha/beta fold hydrolase [Pseudorhodoplanes sp.]|uniref:alpha/beta fold hydrolase n=1 Tax=Pseudorhodoplanes sp. TaxID=1934341 RepID=UPI003D10EE44
MPSPHQHIRFCRSADGTRIAYASFGEGPPLLWVGHFARHLELDWHNPVWSAWLSWLGRRHSVFRYDLRGCGLSDRDVPDISLERLAEDFEAVVDAAGLGRFIFFGTAGNVAPAVRYAGRYPDRIERLVLWGCHTRGRLCRSRSPDEDREAEARLEAFQLGWTTRSSAFAGFFAAMHAPDAPPEYNRSLSELLRATTSPQVAVGIIRSYWRLDLRAALQLVQCPTLILHANGDPIVPFEEGRLAASLVPGARFVPIDSGNHILVDPEPGWRPFTSAVDEFLPASLPPAAALGSLTQRERQVLDAIARGQGNQEIAGELGITAKTVRNHVSTIFDKLQVGSRAQAVIMARDHGLGRRGDR